MITFNPTTSMSDSRDDRHPLYASISFIVNRALREDLAVPVGDAARRLWEASMDATLTVPGLEAELRRVLVQRGVPFDP